MDETPDSPAESKFGEVIDVGDVVKARRGPTESTVDRSTPGRNRLQTLAPWVIALASVVVAAALVVIALTSAQTRDAEREQACYARVLTLGSNYSEVVGQRTFGTYSLSDSAEQARDICDMKFGRGA